MNSLFSELFRKFSGVILGVCETIWRLFGGHFGGVCEDLGGKTIQRVNAKTGKAVFFTI